MNAEFYLESLNAAGVRVRNIMLVLITASVLALSGIWSSFHFSWVNSFIATYSDLGSDARRYADSLNQSPAASVGEFPRLAEYFALRGLDSPWKNMGDDDRLAMISTLESRFTEAEARYLDLRADHQLFTQVPVLGISIDNNDLALFSGLSFLIILLWLRHALASEKRALDVYFEQAEFDCAKRRFDAASLQQVFVAPKLGSQKRFRAGLIRKTTVILIVLPVVIQGIIFANFVDTLPFGQFVNPVYAVVVTVAGGVLLMLTGIACVVCLRKVSQIHQKWTNEALKL